jgi:hypothetical protein
MKPPASLTARWCDTHGQPWLSCTQCPPGLPAATIVAPDLEPGYGGTVGPFPGQYRRLHVYARDVRSGAGSCVCGRTLGHELHTEAAPGVPIPRAMRFAPSGVPR